MKNQSAALFFIFLFATALIASSCNDRHARYNTCPTFSKHIKAKTALSPDNARV